MAFVKMTNGLLIQVIEDVHGRPVPTLEWSVEEKAAFKKAFEAAHPKVPTRIPVSED